MIATYVSLQRQILQHEHLVDEGEFFFFCVIVKNWLHDDGHILKYSKVNFTDSFIWQKNNKNKTLPVYLV